MFKGSDGFRQLVDLYSESKDDSIGLYLGAGVNLPPPGFKGKITYKTYTWKNLLRAIYERNKDQYSESFETMNEKNSGNWADLAEALAGEMAPEVLAEQLDQILYQTMSRKDKDARLEQKMLDQAPTLHAAIRFSTRIKNKNEKSKKGATWTFARNPRVGTVVTPNYDFFFGAGWTLYQAFRKQWKVSTPFPSEEGANKKQRTYEIQRNINYIHGYLPYRLNPKRALVLTSNKYKEFYEPGGFARKTLEEVVKNYHLIFIGTSLDDVPVLEILKAAKREHGAHHFAMEKSPDSTRLKQFEEMGIIAVPVNDYAEIAEALEELYCIGLESSNWERFGLNNKDYWRRLEAGPRGSLRD